MLPNLHDTDGFFAAVLQKKSDAGVKAEEKEKKRPAETQRKETLS